MVVLNAFWHRFPSKHLLVLKTSSTGLQGNNFTSSKASWRRLAKTPQRPLVKTFRKRLEEVLKTSCKTSPKTKNCYAEDVLKTSWRHVLKTSWRHVFRMHLEGMSWRCLEDISWRQLEDIMGTNKYLLRISVSNKSKCVSNKSIFFTNLYLTILGRIQNALIRTQ